MFMPKRLRWILEMDAVSSVNIDRISIEFSFEDTAMDSEPNATISVCMTL